MFDAKKLRISLIVLGGIAFVLALFLFCTDVGHYESNEYYGGDAYTGIQQAAAQAANNVLAVGKMIRLGIGGLLVVQGCMFFAAAFCIKTEAKAEVDIVTTLDEKPLLESSKEELKEDSCNSEQKEQSV